MANTPRLSWPLPNEFSDPWIEAFRSLVSAQEASAYASREDRHLIFRGGGSFTFTGGTTNTLVWVDTIEIASPIKGFFWQVDPASVVMQEGAVLYAQLSRSPTTNQTVSIGVGQQVPSSDDHLVLAIRRGNRIYFINGKSIGLGESSLVFEGGKNSSLLSLANNETTDQGTFTVIGNFILSAAAYGDVKFLVIASITVAVLTGEIELFQHPTGTDPGGVILTLSFTGAGALSPTRQISGSLALPADDRLYEVRHRVLGGAPPDSILTAWAGFQLQ